MASYVGTVGLILFIFVVLLIGMAINGPGRLEGMQNPETPMCGNAKCRQGQMCESGKCV